VQRAIVIHYHEINLKGGNRGWFESRLQKNIEALLQDIPHGGICRFAGRMWISLSPASQLEEMQLRLGRVFGIANFAVASEVPADLDAIRFALDDLIRTRSFRTFKIDARRGTKDFALNSQQLNEQLGEFVRLRSGAAVRLDHPELTCFVEIAGPHAFLYLEKLPGGGGLPASTGGRVLCLISGGIDSPIAAFRMMRRGCRVIFIHFHSFPHTSTESQDKVRRILRILSCYQLQSKLHLVPFAEVQRQIVAYAPPTLRVILYRRFMVRIAEAVAHKERALALVTGDSLGQVASQTLENMRAVSAAAALPVFRPLVGDDKEDIIQKAREIGTYSLSILPDQDCCSLFVPRHPETMARLEQVEQAESSLDVSQLIEDALGASTHEVIAPDFSCLKPGTSELS
jgi:thiamine biosynthesis protein ThiI